MPEAVAIPTITTLDEWRSLCIAWMQAQYNWYRVTVCLSESVSPLVSARKLKAMHDTLEAACNVMMGVSIALHFFVPAAGEDRRPRLLLSGPLSAWTALEQWCAQLHVWPVGLIQDGVVGCWMALSPAGELMSLVQETHNA